MVQIFSYNDQSVSFKEVNGDVLVNATTMAKSFGKLPHEWLRLPSTESFLKALCDSKGIIPVAGKSLIVDLVQVVKGGLDINNQGTWMHEDVAYIAIRKSTDLFK